METYKSDIDAFYREKAKNTSKIYYQKHRKDIIEYQKKYNKEHREEINARKRVKRKEQRNELKKIRLQHSYRLLSETLTETQQKRHDYYIKHREETIRKNKEYRDMKKREKEARTTT